MRGSPLFRTLMLAGGLLLAGWGMLRFGGSAAANAPAGSPSHSGAHREEHPVGFALKLSSAPMSVELKDRTGKVLFKGSPQDPLTGRIALDAADPAVFVTIHWSEAAPHGLNHFAKLTLEPAGKPTLVHYFEAPGDLADVWELPTE